MAEYLKFAKKWIANRYTTTRKHAQDLWESLCNQFEVGGDSASLILEFNEITKQLWPKYLQVALNEMSQELKQKPQKLEASNFDELPDSSILNLNDTKLFKDFLMSDFHIETCRAFKMFAVASLAKTEEEMLFMENLCKVNHLEPDENDIYNGIL